MYTENHEFTLTYPIPINTRGFIFSLSTFVTPFTDSKKSGFRIISTFIYFISLPGCNQSPVSATTVYTLHSPHGLWLSTQGYLCMDAHLTQLGLDSLWQPPHYSLRSDYPAGPFSVGTLSTPVGLQYPTLWHLDTPWWAAMEASPPASQTWAPTLCHMAPLTPPVPIPPSPCST